MKQNEYGIVPADNFKEIVNYCSLFLLKKIFEAYTNFSKYTKNDMTQKMFSGKNKSKLITTNLKIGRDVNGLFVVRTECTTFFYDVQTAVLFMHLIQKWDIFDKESTFDQYFGRPK